MLFQNSCRRLAARPVTMPLRAKISAPALASRNFASSAVEIKELPGDEPNDVMFGNQYGVRTVTLNRPKKLNSLNASMARKIVPRLQEWKKSQLANVVVIKGEGRALCAGGDVAALAQANQRGKKGQQSSKDYFALEYKLDHLIATYPKPYVAFMDGITMGGGVGLSVHAPFRIATENTVFAMPETTIGFFPDVGASFFLPRLDGELGTYLALTSEQIKGVNVFYSGIATHYLHSSSLPDLEARLGELQFNDNATLEERLKTINSTIEEFTTGLPHDQPIASPIGGDIREAIDYAFQPANDMDKILDALEGMTANESKEISTWATKTRDTIIQRSPTSVRVALQQLRKGKTWSIAETFRREHAMACKFMEHPDFVEGVSSLLIRKPRTTPQWQPSELSKIVDADIDAFFTATPDLELLSTEDYSEYPHAWIGLPREKDVESFVNQKGNVTIDETVKHFVAITGGKLGAKEKVEELLSRKAEEENGRLRWNRDRA